MMVVIVIRLFVSRKFRIRQPGAVNGAVHRRKQRTCALCLFVCASQPHGRACGLSCACVTLKQNSFERFVARKLRAR